MQGGVARLTQLLVKGRVDGSPSSKPGAKSVADIWRIDCGGVWKLEMNEGVLLSPSKLEVEVSIQVGTYSFPSMSSTCSENTFLPLDFHLEHKIRVSPGIICICSTPLRPLTCWNRRTQWETYSWRGLSLDIPLFLQTMIGHFQLS